jgi:GxxExxY protein
LKTIVNTDYKYSSITGKIIGCAFEVHNTLGPGFQERIYQRALAIEMSLQGINFIREYENCVFYKTEIVGKRRSDFLVEGEISVELKAVKEWDDADLCQAINYLEVYNREIGLLINFGSKRLQYKRLINAKFNPDM